MLGMLKAVQSAEPRAGCGSKMNWARRAAPSHGMKTHFQSRWVMSEITEIGAEQIPERRPMAHRRVCNDFRGCSGAVVGLENWRPD